MPLLFLYPFQKITPKTERIPATFGVLFALIQVILPMSRQWVFGDSYTYHLKIVKTSRKPTAPQAQSSPISAGFGFFP
jgi:hypothetical protein